MTFGYVYKSIDKEAERLKILNEIYNPSTLSKLEKFLTKEANVLEIGPGVGLLGIEITKRLSHPLQYIGLDQDSKQVERAQANFQEAGLPDCCILQGNVIEIDKITALDNRRFDIIFCRWVMAHIPAEILTFTLKNLYNRLNPGGKLICEEGDVSTVHLISKKELAGDPSKKAFEAWYGFSFALEKLYNIDLRLGIKIGQALLDATGQIPDSDTFQPRLSTPDHKIMLSYAIASTKTAVEQVVASGLVPFFDSHVARTLEENLVKLAYDASIDINYIRNYFTFVKKPNLIKTIESPA